MMEWKKIQLMLEKVYSEIESSSDLDGIEIDMAYTAMQNYFITNHTYSSKEVKWCQAKLHTISELLANKKKQINETIKDAIDKASKHECYLRSIALQEAE